MLKYFCLIVLIMSSFGWTQKPIEFQKVTTYPNDTWVIDKVEYFKVNKNNKLEKIREVSFHYDKNNGGNVKSDIPYVNNERHGYYKSHHSDGSIQEIGSYKYGNKEGKWYQYHWNGNTREVLYKNGEVVKESDWK